MDGRRVIGREELPLGHVPGRLLGVDDLDGDGGADLLWADHGVLRATGLEDDGTSRVLRAGGGGEGLKSLTRAPKKSSRL
jgi:hypothetical protein